METNEPPKPSEITPDDRAVLRDRVKAALAAKDNMSQRKAEEALNLSTGVLSKVWSGDMQLTVDLLRRLAELLGVDPFELVAGTGFEGLRMKGVETPESPELRTLRGQLDEARVALAAAQAENESLRRSAEAARQAHEAAERRTGEIAARESAAVASLGKKEAELVEARSALAKARAEATTARRGAEQAEATASGLRAAVAEHRAQADGWRAHASQMENLARSTEAQLEAVNAAYLKLYNRANAESKARTELARSNAALRKEASSKVEGGAALGGTALAFLVGLAVAEGAKPKRRR